MAGVTQQHHPQLAQLSDPRYVLRFSVCNAFGRPTRLQFLRREGDTLETMEDHGHDEIATAWLIRLIKVYKGERWCKMMFALINPNIKSL